MRNLVLLFCLACLACLPACGGRATDYYVMPSGVEPLSAPTMPARTMSVGANVPDYVDRTAIVVRDASGSHLDVPSFNLWAEPLSQGVARVVSDNIARPMLDAGVCVLASRSSRIVSDFVLSIDVVRLDCDSNGHVVCEARWTLYDDPNAPGVARGSWAAAKDIDMKAVSYGSREMFTAIANAEGELVARMGADIGKSLPGLIRR